MATKRQRKLKLKGITPLNVGSPLSDDDETFYISDEDGRFIFNAFSRNQMREIVRLLDPSIQNAFASGKRTIREGICYKDAQRKIDFSFTVEDENQSDKGELLLSAGAMETPAGKLEDGCCEDFDLQAISLQNWNAFVAWI